MTAPMPDAQSVPPAQPAQPSGLVYADVPNRVIAYIIDYVIIIAILIVVGIVLAAVGIAAGGLGSSSVDTVGSIILGAISLILSAAYFIWTWTSRRATFGMSVLGMQIGNAGDGRTLTTEQALRRYLALAAPSILSYALGGIPGVGAIIGLLGLLWVIFLLYTTANSPTKQGWHDVFANTQVVKAAKTV
jgi:uncharacterized RDD family membrane protein YckC